MSTIATTYTDNRNLLFRSIVFGGLITGVIHMIIHQWFFTSLIFKNPFIIVQQYIASGALGMSAFEGGLSTALLGVLFHFLITFVIVAVFILSANRIPLLRRYVFVSALLYGFGVWVVMNLIVIPLSATPPLPAPTMPQLIESVLEHILVIGTPLAIIVRRNANRNE